MYFPLHEINIKNLVKYCHLCSFYINYLWWVSMFQKGDASRYICLIRKLHEPSLFITSDSWGSRVLFPFCILRLLFYQNSKVEKQTLFGWKLFLQWGNFEQDISVNVSKNCTIMICTFDNCEQKSLHDAKIGQYYTPCISFPSKVHC